MQLYTIDADHNPVPCHSVMEWVRSFEKLDAKCVAWSEIAPGVTVSTVFIGLDMRKAGLGAPILFETIAFVDDGGDGETRRSTPWPEVAQRYTTWADAEIGHAAICSRLRSVA